MNVYVILWITLQSVQLVLFLTSFFLPVLYKGDGLISLEMKRLWNIINLSALLAGTAYWLSAPAQPDLEFTLSFYLVAQILASSLSASIIAIAALSLLLYFLDL